MSPSQIITENDERLIAEDIVVMLSQKGVSCEQAQRILSEACTRVAKVPIVELTSQNA